jgi:hypothetical protein
MIFDDTLACKAMTIMLDDDEQSDARRQVIGAKLAAISSLSILADDKDSGEAYRIRQQQQPPPPHQSTTGTTTKSNRSRQPFSSQPMSIPIGALLILTTTLISPICDAYKHQQDAGGDQLHPSLFVDTKYWARNMEFGQRDNWAGRLKPCTLLESISIDQNEAVISLGDGSDNSLGSIESTSVRELLLANDGVLLLSEDTLDSQETYIKFLNESADCFDSSTLPERLQDGHWFRFEPSSDRLSWFNAANWISALNDGIAELVPDSHQIPCSEDVVVFGSSRVATWLSIKSDTSERSPAVPFKVNFRPSEQMMVQQAVHKRDYQQAIVDTLRVSKLKIGDKSYSQDEFDQLVRLYRDNLFDFNDSESVFGRLVNNQSIDTLRAAGLEQRPQTVLTIDESSSIESTEHEQNLCLDEAGCLCGNEQPKIMNIICSFNQPLELSNMLCRDPVRSHGYCNPICATSITINMTPTKFSERYLSNLLNKLLTGQISDVTLPSIDYFSDHIFVGSRRVDHNKYEITIRLVPEDDDVYSSIIGRDLELARLIKQQLEKGKS